MAKPKVTKTERAPLLTTRTPTTAARGESTRVETVTPALAAEWLKSNTRNRRVMDRMVASLAEAITDGHWRVTHQGIAFGADGSLYDGQHRLLAIVRAGIPVSVSVTRGLAVEAMDAIDTGCARRAYDVITISDGVRIGHTAASVYVAAALLAQRGALDGSTPRITPNFLRAAIEEHGADFGVVQTNGKFSNAALNGAFVIAHRTLPIQTEEFVALFVSGAGLSEGHPALALRNFFFTRFASSGGGRARDDLAGRVFAAIDAFDSGRDVMQLKRNEAARARFLRPWRKAAERGEG